MGQSVVFQISDLLTLGSKKVQQVRANQCQVKRSDVFIGFVKSFGAQF